LNAPPARADPHVDAEPSGPLRILALPERARFPLVWKLFGVTALLILFVVAVAIGITIERANAIARKTVDESISSAARLFKTFERLRLDKLELGAQQLGKTPSFHAYVQAALAGPTSAPEIPSRNGPQAGPGTSSGTIDFASIIDQLLQNQTLLGSDLMMLLDDQGRLIARTDHPAIASGSAQDLYESMPLVRQIVDDATIDKVSGVILLDGKLYHAALAPLSVGANNIRIAYIVNAYAIDDAFANSIAESARAGVVFVPAPDRGTPPAIARSSGAPSYGSMQQMGAVERIIGSGKVAPPSTVEIDRGAYVMTGQPLTSKDRTVGAAIFVRSLDRELAPFREIRAALLIGGGIALLLAFILSWFVARRLTRPIEELATIAQSVTAGDYDVRPNISRSDEVGILGRSFAKMITALRDKAELEELYEQMAARSAEREAHPAVLQAPRLDEGTILVTDLRGLPPVVGSGDAASVIARVEKAIRLQETEITRQEGQVRGVEGHRLISIFPGERGIVHAIRAARAIDKKLAMQADQATPMGIAAGIATGEFVSGSVSLPRESGWAMVGNAPLLALLFAGQAPTGVAYISYETAQTAGGDILASSVREEVRLKWLPQSLFVASIPLETVTTQMIRSIDSGVSTSTAATMRLDVTAPGSTAPSATASSVFGSDLSPGTLFANRYLVEQILGRGGMGVVYRANDRQLDETVAIKTLPGDVMSRTPEDLERFKREIRLARKITHRNVLRTFDYGEADGVYFISMEYVRGYTLSELLQESPQMSMRVAMGVGRQICRGLQAAHEQGIIHRDIKPQNVLIDHRGEVKLMDFGIARMTESAEGMTQAGLVVGTPHYMSPEQVQGRALDARSDVYSMGIMIYEMLCGRRPFEAPALMAVLTAHITETPRPAIEIRPELDPEINRIVMKCLAKDPRQRYANAGELLSDLDQVQIATAA
jgi:HAMP domain-containing protein/predicted Ser/Thr protein kinase